MAGIKLPQIADDSHLRLVREVIMNPRATNDALIVASVDPSTIGAGGTCTIAFAHMLRPARKITVTLNDDDAGGGLTGRFQISGHRFGVPISEVVTVTCTDTNDTVGTTTLVFDQVTEVRILSLTADSGDDLTVGISGDGLGLMHPIDNVSDVLQVVKIVSGTEQTPLTLSSSNVSVANASFDHGGTITAANDAFVVTYRRSVKRDDLGRKGVFA